jgi:hypothetical protein
MVEPDTPKAGRYFLSRFQGNTIRINVFPASDAGNGLGGTALQHNDLRSLLAVVPLLVATSSFLLNPDGAIDNRERPQFGEPSRRSHPNAMVTKGTISGNSQLYLDCATIGLLKANLLDQSVFEKQLRCFIEPAPGNGHLALTPPLASWWHNPADCRSRQTRHGHDCRREKSATEDNTPQKRTSGPVHESPPIQERLGKMTQRIRPSI